MIPAALEIKGGEGIGFEEQTYAIIYEVAKTDDERTKDIEGVPIYSTYTTGSSSDPVEISEVKAIYPTRKGLLDLCKAIEANDLIEKYFPNHSWMPDNDKYTLREELIRDILQHDVFLDMTHGENYFQDVQQLAPNRKMSSAQAYRYQKNKFQSLSPIRIAMVGGLHRTATVCHLYAGITPTPNSTLRIPKNNKSDTNYNITEDMVVNATTALTFLIPKKQVYNNNYMKQIRAYSYRIDIRKTLNLEATYRSLTLMILDHNRHNDFPPINLRFVEDDIFTNSVAKVCTKHFINTLWFFHDF